MIKGVCEDLEQLLDHFNEDDSDEAWNTTCYALACSVAAGANWLVPVVAMPEGANETDYPDGLPMKKLPGMVRRTIEREDQEPITCVFTCLDRTEAQTEECYTVTYPARDVLEEFLESGSDQMMINPWSNDLLIKRRGVERILKCADEVTPRDLQKLKRIEAKPRAVLDTNAILASWQEGWEGADCENWELKNYPIMADGRLLLHFEMRNEMHDENGQLNGQADSRNRVLEYRILEKGLEPMGKYKFSFENTHISTVFCYDGKLRAVVRHNSKHSYWVLSLIPDDLELSFKVFGNIETLITNSREQVIAAYNKNLMDEAHAPLMVFDKDGVELGRYEDSDALACLDVNLDAQERIWFHLYPSDTIDCFDPEKGVVERHRVALQRFGTFAFSTDMSRLFVSFTEYEGGSVQYVMTRNQNGDYADPVRFEFAPTNSEGEELEAKDCKVFGKPSSMKSWVVLNADGKLYLYHVDDF